MFSHIYVCRHGIFCTHRLSAKQLFPARSVKNTAPSNKRSGGFAFICAARALLQVVVLFHFDARFPEQFQTEVVGIAIFEHYPFDSRIYNHLCTYGARLVCAVKRCPVNGNAQLCRLDYRVLLRVDRITYLVTGTRRNAQLYPDTFALFHATQNAAARAVVTGRQNALVLGDYGAHVSVRFETA